MFRALVVVAMASFPIATAPSKAQQSIEHCVAGPDAEAEILRLDAQRIDALLRNDVEVLESLTAYDYHHVESSGGARGRDQFLSGRRSGRSLFSTFVIEENEVAIYCNVAVVTGRYHNSVVGSETIKRARHLRVYVQRDGEWKNVAHQATEIGRPAR